MTDLLSWLEDNWNIISEYPFQFIFCIVISISLSATAVSFYYKNKIKNIESKCNSLQLEYNALKDAFNNSGVSARLMAGAYVPDNSVSAKNVSEHINTK